MLVVVWVVKKLKIVLASCLCQEPTINRCHLCSPLRYFILDHEVGDKVVTLPISDNRYNLASQICGELGRQVDKFSRHYQCHTATRVYNEYTVSIFHIIAGNRLFLKSLDSSSSKKMILFSPFGEADVTSKMPDSIIYARLNFYEQRRYSLLH